MNECVFSEDRRYRYVLSHRWSELFPRQAITWICLNPGSATETKVDATWRRIKDFSQRRGWTEFRIVNLFAYRTTKPNEMKRALDPIGPENDAWILHVVEESSMVIAAWGAHGVHRQRAAQVLGLLDGVELCCLGETLDGEPRHPLYVRKEVRPEWYRKTASPPF